MYVGSKLCGVVNWKADKHVYKVTCEDGPLKSRLVKVLQEGDYLTLCEVEVLGKWQEPTESGNTGTWLADTSHVT